MAGQTQSTVMQKQKQNEGSEHRAILKKPAYLEKAKLSERSLLRLQVSNPQKKNSLRSNLS